MELSQTELTKLRIDAFRLALDRTANDTPVEDVIKEADKIVNYILNIAKEKDGKSQT